MDPATLTMSLAVGSAVMQGVSSYSQGQAASKAAAYQSQVAANNAAIDKQNAEFAGAEGEQNVGAAAMRTGAQVASIKTAQAANGINVNTGSAVDVRASEAEMGELKALNIRSDAARQAYGYTTQAASATAQSELDKATSKSEKTRSILSGAGSFLGSLSSSANFANFTGGKGLSTDDIGMDAGDDQFLAKVHGDG